jgi:UDP-N-acetylmuramate--alanine ligase
MGTNALSGSRGGWFCVEACEYDRTFLQLSPRGAVVTNVEEDHLDYYGTRAAIHQAFARFAARVARDGLCVLGRAVPEEVELASDATVWRLGRELETDLYCEERGCFTFRLRGPGWATPEVDLGVPGHFNVDNAALALALAIGLTARLARQEPEAVAAGAVAGLVRFFGVQRRFEPWGQVGGVEVVHDYAHHPTEVRVTLEAARRAHPGLPLHVLFQPHQHSRTARFLDDFAESLRVADRVVVADVYGARKHIDAERFAGAPELVLGLQQRGVDGVLGGALDAALTALVRGLPERAAAFILGAGDVELVREDLLEKLAVRGPAAGRARA